MVQSFSRLGVLFAMGLGLTGCGTIEIAEPSGTRNSEGVLFANQPVTPLTANLLSRYKDGFRATLDGAPIGGFTPAPAKNTTVSAPGPECFEGGANRRTGEIDTAQHEFAVFGSPESSGGIEIVSDRMEFFPPGLLIQQRSGVALTLNQSVTITVAIVPGPLGPYDVIIAPEGPQVSVNGLPAGQRLATTFPSNAAGTFRLTGVSPGQFVVRVRARGAQCAAMSGSVR